LQCISNDDFPGKQHCMLYKNMETVDFLTNSAQTTLKNSKKLIETIKTDDISAMLDVSERYLKPYQQIYMLNPSLMMQCADQELLEAVLKDNNVDEEKIKQCVSINEKVRRIKKRCRYISICDLDDLELTSKQNIIVDGNLSEICGKPIAISRERWFGLIKTLVHTDQQSSLTIFTSFSYLSVTLKNLSILVQEDSLIAAWNVTRYKKRMYCINPNVISGFFRYMDDIWHMVPHTCKDIEWRNKQLWRLLENARQTT